MSSGKKIIVLLMLLIFFTATSLVSFAAAEEMSENHIRIHYNAIKEFVEPEMIRILPGETVTWENVMEEDRPWADDRFTLVSNENLWTRIKIEAGEKFSYTFEEPGIYHFKVFGKNNLKGTIQVDPEGDYAKIIKSRERTTDRLRIIKPGELLDPAAEPVSMQKAKVEHMFKIYYNAMPKKMNMYEIKIAAGDTIAWQNTPVEGRTWAKDSFMLQSIENLWERKTIEIGEEYQYQFNDPGTYHFKVFGQKELEGKVIVVKTEELEEEMQIQAMQQKQTVQETQEEEQQTVHTIIFIRNSVTSSSLKVEKGDTVVWKNFNRPKKALVLVSKEELWKDETLYYGKTFTYTFNSKGTYEFEFKDTEVEGEIRVI